MRKVNHRRSALKKKKLGIKLVYFIFVYLAMWGLSCGMQDLSLQCIESLVVARGLSSYSRLVRS